MQDKVYPVPTGKATPSFDTTLIAVPIELFKPMTYRDFVLSRMAPEGVNMENAGLSLASEAGEVAGALKKHLYQRKPFDRLKFIDELSDVRFYYELWMYLINATDDEIITHNISKLTTRYPNGFEGKPSATTK